MPSDRRGKTGNGLTRAASMYFLGNALAPRPKTDNTANDYSHRKASIIDDHAPRWPAQFPMPSEGSKEHPVHDPETVQFDSETDSPEPEELTHFLEANVDLSASVASQRKRLWKEKNQALRRVNIILGQNDDLLQNDEQVEYLPVFNTFL